MFVIFSWNQHAGSVSVRESQWQACDCQQSYAVFSTAVSLSPCFPCLWFSISCFTSAEPTPSGLLFTTEGPHTISRQGSRPARPSLPLSLGSSSLQFYVESSLLSASQCTAGQGFSWIQSGIFNYCPCPVTCTFFMKLFLKWIYVLHFSEESLSAKAQFCVFWVWSLSNSLYECCTITSV